MAYEEYPMSQMDHCGPYSDKPRELNIDDKVEGCEGTLKVVASEEAA